MKKQNDLIELGGSTNVYGVTAGSAEKVTYLRPEGQKVQAHQQRRGHCCEGLDVGDSAFKGQKKAEGG